MYTYQSDRIYAEDKHKRHTQQTSYSVSLYTTDVIQCFITQQTSYSVSDIIQCVAVAHAESKKVPGTLRRTDGGASDDISTKPNRL